MKTSNLKSAAGKIIALLILATGMVCAFAPNVQAVTFNYSSTTNHFINFPGDHTFDFTSGNNFQVTTGTASGLFGEISGTFTIGTVTTFMGTSYADVTGAGMFVIHDGVNTFTANLSWVNIVQTGTGGNLNTMGTVNLTGATYMGTNADLMALRDAGSGLNVLTFQIDVGVTLDQLREHTGSPYYSSFSGTVSAPDGGATVALLGLALAGVESLRRKMKGGKV